MDLFDYAEMSKAADVDEGRRWEALNPEILALIFVRIQPSDEMVRCVPFVCKPWMEVVARPDCWQDINLLPWCRRRYDNDPAEVDRLVEKLVRRSNYYVQRLSTCGIGVPGLLSAMDCGRCLIVLQIPDSSITDNMVLKHMKPLPNLLFLNISCCFEITSKGLAAFGNNCKSLVFLKRNMHSCFGGTDDSEAKTIAHTMPGLQRIELCFGQFGNSGLFEILTNCKSIAHLDIYGCWNVELDGELVKICERLRHFRGPGVNYDDMYDSINSRDVDLPSPTSD